MNTHWQNLISTYLTLPIGLLFLQLMYGKIVSALIFPIILVNNPFVSFA